MHAVLKYGGAPLLGCIEHQYSGQLNIYRLCVLVSSSSQNNTELILECAIRETQLVLILRT